MKILMNSNSATYWMLLLGTFIAQAMADVCTSPVYFCDYGVLYEGSEYALFDQLVTSQCDITSLSSFIDSQGADFEEFMGNKLGNFVVNENPWDSLVSKMNAVAGPILMIPYIAEGVSAEALQTYDTNVNTLMFRDVSGSVEGCETGGAFPPTVIGFPMASPCTQITTEKWYNQDSEFSDQQPLDEMSLKYWVLDWHYEYVAAYSFLDDNSETLCSTQEIDYSHAVTQTASSSATNKFASQFQVGTQATETAKVSASFDDMGASYSESVTSGFTHTVSKSYTSGTTQTQSTSSTVSTKASLNVPGGALQNTTMTVQQVNADLDWTQDLEWQTTKTAIAPYWDRGYADYLQYTTLADVRELLGQVNTMMKYGWSDMFLDALVTSSIGGTAKAIQGVQLVEITNTCNHTYVDDTCTHAQQVQYPILQNDCIDAPEILTQPGQLVYKNATQELVRQ
eukprot:Clim_evm1s170 gene=Clim_evmTU1s170